MKKIKNCPFCYKFPLHEIRTLECQLNVFKSAEFKIIIEYADENCLMYRKGVSEIISVFFDFDNIPQIIKLIKKCIDRTIDKWNETNANPN